MRDFLELPTEKYSNENGGLFFENHSMPKETAVCPPLKAAVSEKSDMTEASCGI
jgi:hypothetical protein